MQRCEVLVVGGGPAGSTCAAALVRDGVDVIVADKAAFPRDKVCAGWITPAVVDELALDLGEYLDGGRTIDPIHGFRVGRMGDRTHLHRYNETVSYGIRRCELDDYLLRRCGARLALGERIGDFRREGGRWKVAGRFDAEVVVGAGGHFCPVARALGGASDDAVVAAEEAEYAMGELDLADCAVESGIPELYFTRDLAGYGWVFRKGDYLNVGLGVRSDGQGAAAVRERGNPTTRERDSPTMRERDSPTMRERIDDFVRYLVEQGRIARGPATRMHGHAYVLQPDNRRTRAGDGFVLIGDAAGLAYDRSGEGIRCAVESGLLAAPVIAGALGQRGVDAEDFAPYETALEERFGAAGRSALDPASVLPQSLRRGLASALMSSEWFSRHVLLERWFLHAHEKALPPAQDQAPLLQAAV